MSEANESPVNLLVTGAAGQIAYALLPRLAALEKVFASRRLALKLVEIPSAMARLEGVAMEVEDCAPKRLASIDLFDDFAKAADGASFAFLLGSLPRGIVYKGKKIEHRSDLLRINGHIFADQGRALGEVAAEGCKVLVVGNPANSNAFIGKENARREDQTWLAMTMLDAKRALWQLAKRAKVKVADVSRQIVWGNHSSTMYPDAANALIDGQPALSHPQITGEWVKAEYTPKVQERGAAIIAARGASSAASAAAAALASYQCALLPTPREDLCWPAAIASDGSYGVPHGLVFGFPLCTLESGEIQIVKGLKHDEHGEKMLAATLAELEAEKAQIKDLCPS